jgi:hypothetical protein
VSVLIVNEIHTIVVKFFDPVNIPESKRVGDIERGCCFRLEFEGY